jgi:hypothetical protein
MDPKIELKLLETIYKFKGMTLAEAQFKEKTVKGKNYLTLELVFSDNGVWQTMVLVLNKDLTTGDYQDIYEEIIS